MDAKDVALFVLAAYGALSMCLDFFALLAWWIGDYPDD